MIKILFIGDIVGKIGREAVAQILPKLRKENNIDLVIANAENSAHGSGITERTISELRASGVDYFTNGDHALGRRDQGELYDLPYILRPANFPPKVFGRGHILIPCDGKNILLINLVGRVYMKAHYDCPFRKLDEILANENLQANNISAIIVDIHAEATSEKAALRHYADGRVSAVLGTHTHVMTADADISDKGTAFISDVGMVGAGDSTLGVAKEGIIRTFLSQIKENHVIPKRGKALFNAVIVSINPKNMTANSIKPIIKKININ
jgi:2',3'-cyclic-nucleotide 2'-phosphodiesterase